MSRGKDHRVVTSFEVEVTNNSLTQKRINDESRFIHERTTHTFNILNLVVIFFLLLFN